MKLLFDENLSPRLVTRLADLFPASIHVRDIGLQAADDPSVWEYARRNGFLIVSNLFQEARNCRNTCCFLP